MPLTPLSSVIPPGGFHFVDRSGGDEVRIEGSGFEDVAAKVLQHRLVNGRPPGDPLQELIQYVCGSWPHFCRESGPASISSQQRRSRSVGIAERVAAWFAHFHLLARQDPGVSGAETQRRADICAECPQNREFRSGCGSCVENIQRLFFVWRRDRPIPREKELHACRVTGQHNGAAVLAKQLPPLDPEEQARLPAQCWRK